MAQMAICTICSREKLEDRGMLPARERYTGSHITRVEELAISTMSPFFILSGVYGLLTPDEPIPHYDHVLTQVESPDPDRYAHCTTKDA